MEHRAGLYPGKVFMTSLERRDGHRPRTVLMAEKDDFPAPESDAEKRFQTMVKKRMEEKGENMAAAEYGVALTAEGQAAWEEARKARLRRG